MTKSSVLIALVIVVLVGCSLAMPPFRGRLGKGPGGRPMGGPGRDGPREGKPGRRHHNPLLMLACSMVNTTSGEVIKERDCPRDVTCALGPLSLELCDGTPVQATYCDRAPEEPTSRPLLAKLACSLKSVNGTIDKSKPCPGNDTCSLGPLTLSIDGTDAEAMFSQRQRTEEEDCEMPEEGKGSSEEEDEDDEESADDSESLESSEEEDEGRLNNGNGPLSADRRRQFGGRRGGRQKRRAGGRGGRRHRNPLLGLACLVVDEEGTPKETRHQCQGDIGCNVGPLYISTSHGELSAFYCDEDAVQVEGDGLRLTDLACQLTFDDGSVESEDCPREGQCTLGPLDVNIDGQNAEALFCQREPGLVDDIEPSSRRGHGGRRGLRPEGGRPDSSEEVGADSSEEVGADSSEEVGTTPAAPELPFEP